MKPAANIVDLRFNMMATQRHINLFFMVLSILMHFTHGAEDYFPAEDNATALEKIVTVNNEFALKLHRSLSENSYRNIFFSPTSLLFALGMLYVGAQGETAQELQDFLGYNRAGLFNEEINDSFSQLLKKIFSSSQDFTLKTANVLLVDPQLKLMDNYLKQMQFYKANVLQPYINQNKHQVLQEINGWISNQTDGKIAQFLEDWDRSTIMLVLNAVYFKGLWSIPFGKRDNIKARFYNYGGTQKSKLVDMMRKSHRMLYTSSPDWEMVELPYKGDRVSMLIILPKQLDGLAAVEKSLTPEQILTYRNKLRPSTVNLTLPKFKIDSKNNLNQNLFSLGLQKMFQRGADFSGIAQNTAVRVSSIMQKAIVEVNEEGTVAAAATGVHLVPLSLQLPRIFTVDHPFLFAIIDTETGLLLFTGRVISL